MDGKTTGRVFDDLYDRYLDSKVEEPPSERIAAYVAALLERWCDPTEDEEDTSPPPMLVTRAALVDQGQARRNELTRTVIAEVPLGKGAGVRQTERVALLVKLYGLHARMSAN
ncbi:hypothetical protein ACFVQ4_03730 [Streptomyces laurentii]|uniref:hypothetical protein n=1 Tax=Streptomyces laurentii TaxID=39478 RepID=UPI0036799F8B